MFIPTTTVLRKLCVATACLCALAANAEWPDRPINIIVPYGPGGISDSIARQVAQSMTTALKQPVIVENKAGAGGMLAAKFVAGAKPDGYTILLNGSGAVLTQIFYKNPLVKREELTTVGMVATQANFLAVNNRFKANTLKEMLAMGREKPGSLSCGHAGYGSSTYVACLLLEAMSGVDLTLVSYKGSVPAIVDVLGNNLSMAFGSEALPYILDGRMKGLAVSSPEASAAAPTLPPIASEVPGYDVTSWIGFFAPAGTPQPIIDKLNQQLGVAVSSQGMQNLLKTFGASSFYKNTKESQQFVDAEFKRWDATAKRLNITPE